MTKVYKTYKKGKRARNVTRNVTRNITRNITHKIKRKSKSLIFDAAKVHPASL